MELNIDPFKGVGSIKLGMTPDEVHLVLGIDFKRSKRLPDDESTFKETNIKEGIMLVYDEQSKLEAVELLHPAKPVFRDVPLLRTSYKELVPWFKQIDSKTFEDSDGLRAPSLGIALYAPKNESGKYPKKFPKTVFIHTKDFYSNIERRMEKWRVEMRKKPKITLEELRRRVGL